MTPSILFFQVAATVIPTIAVAVVVSGKVFDLDSAQTLDDDEQKSMAHRMRTRTNETVVALATVLYFTAATLGERAALAALYYKEPAEPRADVVIYALGVSVASLFIKVLDPFVTASRRAKDYKAVVLLGGAVSLGLILILAFPL